MNGIQHPFVSFNIYCVLTNFKKMYQKTIYIILQKILIEKYSRCLYQDIILNKIQTVKMIDFHA